jgi:hypothetical protein
MRQKLRQTSGASFIVALLVVMICLMVGSVVVAAATAGVQHAQERRRDRQEYLSLSSAADLLSSEIGKAEVDILTTTTTHTAKNAVDHYSDDEYFYYKLYSQIDDYKDSTQTSSELKSVSSGISSALLEMTNDIRAQLKNAASDPASEKTLTITPGKDSGLRAVEADLSMDGNYNVTAKLSIQTSDDYQASYTPFVVTYKAIENVENGNSKKIGSDKLGFYAYKVYYFGLKWYDGEVELSYDITTTTDTDTITWNYSTLTKGTVIGE